MGINTNDDFFIAEIQSVILPGIPETELLRCRFVLAHYHDDLFRRYGVPFAQAIRKAVTRRKAEYLAGRYLCKKMLEAHGLPPAVPTGANREPLWPGGWLGSITHSADMAMSGFCRKSDIALLGMDLEAWLQDSVANDIADKIIDRRERYLLAGPWPFSQGLTLIFSAKESFFKAVFPLVRRHFDFDCVRMVAIDYKARCFSMEVLQPLAPELQPGRQLHGTFRCDAHGILTLVAERAGGAAGPARGATRHGAESGSDKACYLTAPRPPKKKTGYVDRLRDPDMRRARSR